MGKKDSSPAPQESANLEPVIEDGVDPRIFGTWLLLETNMVDENSGLEIPSHKLRALFTISKDQFTYTVEMVKSGKLICSSGVSTNYFSVSKDAISIHEKLSNTSVVDEETDCSVDLEKTSVKYDLKSDHVIIVTAENGEVLTVNRHIK
ncbi:MAG: hypothetical protein KBD78_09805 [Oligoflexales bacterium]|nr:hypothetical protein [Oligoflexales bacterium]